MTIDFARSLFLVHPVDTDAGTEEDPNPGFGGPDLSDLAAISVARQGETGWYILTHEPSGRRVAVWRCNAAGSLGLYSVHGPTDLLAAIAARADVQAIPVREAWRRRTEPAIASRLRWWRWWRCEGAERDPEGAVVAFSGVRQLAPGGSALGTISATGQTIAALPWDLDADGRPTTQALAVRRVTAISRPCLPGSLAGMGLDVLFEDEEDPGA